LKASESAGAVVDTQMPEARIEIAGIEIAGISVQKFLEGDVVPVQVPRPNFLGARSKRPKKEKMRSNARRSG
jgi:hypothetical protein